jgi:FMN phosphatase YigB (HAD superfamily)
MTPAKRIFRGNYLSFDALGTLFDFKEPVAAQYLKVARKCGVTAPIAEDDIQQAFKAVYKQHTLSWPNYGKGSKSVDSPETWWQLLVHSTFRRLLPEEAIPTRLGSETYQHFASGSAYQLRPGVLSMFRRLRWARGELASSSWMTCVISNSDPRVSTILRDLGLKVGESPPGQPATYDPENDIDFVCTSYEASSEKPDAAIFRHAKGSMAALVGVPVDELVVDGTSIDGPQGPGARWFHVGDDFKKDCVGASEAGFIPVHLCPEDVMPESQSEMNVESLGGIAISFMQHVVDDARRLVAFRNWRPEEGPARRIRSSRTGRDSS